VTRIEDYGFLSDTQTGALVSREGSVDWLCFPRFDSPACFAALLGKPENGRWLIAPAAEMQRCTRRYRGDSLILETTFETADGAVRLIDFMPPRGKNPDIVRIVEGISGRLALRMQLVVRFDYGNVVPWVRKRGGSLEALAGPDALVLHAAVETHGENLTTVAEFTVAAGDRLPFVLTWFPSHEPAPRKINPEHALQQTEEYWHEWSARCGATGEWREAVTRSLIVLKGLTYAPTGGIVAALTTSLPEEIGGVRNWDYRYCWIRDATFTLIALMSAGFLDEACSWRKWLLRAVAGSPSQMQIMYGVRGERRLEEAELPWLDGYENSRPVRIGNAASHQFQLDVYGEVMDAIYQSHLAGIETTEVEWHVQIAIIRFLESNWHKPDEGIWEVRGPRQHFTHSKVMAWVAFDRAVKLVEGCNCPAEEHLDRWREIRDIIHEEVCRLGFNERKGAFTQAYGSDAMDASILMLPLVGFLPIADARVRGTIDAVERELLLDGFVRRYIPHQENVDGLPGDEGTFLACSFWFVDCLHLLGRTAEARAMFERLLAIRNELGLLAEEYEPRSARLLGNFPQAFSHIGLINTARILRGAPAT
jgi:GH15 family glucan-1,4-alpha-glucosidase